MADAAGGDPTVTAPTAVLGMGTIIALLAITVTYWLLFQNKVRGSPFDAPAAAPAPEPEQPGDFVFIGVKPRALTRLLDIYPEIVGKKLTTSDVCHTILKPMTVPAGWVDRATCTNAEESWYAHQYHREGQTEQLQDAPPPGTCSYADLLKKDPEPSDHVGELVLPRVRPEHCGEPDEVGEFRVLHQEVGVGAGPGGSLV